MLRRFGQIVRGLFSLPHKERERAVGAGLLQASAAHKLGGGWFTRSLTPGTRRARLRSLTRAELDAAVGRGWLSPVHVEWWRQVHRKGAVR